MWSRLCDLSHQSDVFFFLFWMLRCASHFQFCFDKGKVACSNNIALYYILQRIGLFWHHFLCNISWMVFTYMRTSFHHLSHNNPDHLSPLIWTWPFSPLKRIHHFLRKFTPWNFKVVVPLCVKSWAAGGGWLWTSGWNRVVTVIGYRRLAQMIVRSSREFGL